MTDKIEIFNDNAEFFERFSNSNQELTTDRLGRSRKTIHGIEKIVEDSINGAVDGIGTAKDSAIQDINDMGDSVGVGKVVRESVVDSEGTGKVVRQSVVKENSLRNGGSYFSPPNNPAALQAGDSGLATSSSFKVNNSGLEFEGISGVFLHYYVQQNYRSDPNRLVAFFNGYSSNDWFISVTRSDGSWRKPSRFYGTHNTIVDSNGNIKSASPVLRLFDNKIETNGQFSEDPIFEKISTGKYKISNTLGLATEGWCIETPKDKNGLPYFMVDWEQGEESHDVIIRVFKKKLDLETLDFVSGEPVDIGEEQRWIDLRFHEEPQELEGE